MTKPSLILHLPVHKTGSTALQQALHFNEVPLNGRKFTYLPRFTHSFQHDDLTKKTGENLRILLTAMRESAGDRSIILSTEKLHLIEDAGIQDFMAAVMGIFVAYDINVVIYLRRQDDAFSSFYNQIVKFGTTTDTTSQAFMHYGKYFNYERYLKLFKDNLRESDSLTVRLYDRDALVDRDIVADFLKIVDLQVDLAGRPTRVINHSLEKSVFELKRAMNSHLEGSPSELIQSLAGVLADASSRINNGKPDTNILSELERDLIMACFAESNKRVLDQYLGGAALAAEKTSNAPYESTFELVLPAVLARLARYFYHINKIAKR